LLSGGKGSNAFKISGMIHRREAFRKWYSCASSSTC
jgi:hypothetical protein